MTGSLANRRTAGIISAALAFSNTAAVAEAMPNVVGSADSSVSSHQVAPPATTPRVTASHPAGGGLSDWGYVGIGSSVASLVVISVGGTRVVSRRRRRHGATAQPRIAG